MLKASLKTCFFITNIDSLPQLYSSWICCIICILLYLTPIRAPFIWYFFQFTEYIKFPFNFFTLKLFRIHLWLLKKACYKLERSALTNHKSLTLARQKERWESWKAIVHKNGKRFTSKSLPQRATYFQIVCLNVWAEGNICSSVILMS